MLNTGKMQLKWYRILFFHLMCIGLALSQNATSDGLPAEPFILYSNTTNLRSLDLVSFAQANVLGGQNRTIPLGVDTVYQHIYFGDFNLGRISRSNYDGSNVSIIMEKVKQVEGLAVDWINRLMYWTKYPSATIEVATLDGLYRTVLINTGLQYPRGMAVDPIAGYFFWSDWGSAAAIERSFLDGSNRVTLVTKNITWPNGVTLDTSQRLVYWTDGYHHEISSVDYDGNNRRLIFEYSSLPFHYGHVNAFDLDISGDYLYFSEWFTNAIYEVKISSGTLVRYIYVPTIHSIRGVMGLRVIHSAKQQAGTSNCGNDNGGCEQLCFHKVPTGTSCGCQFGMKLASDGMSCEHNVSNGGNDNFNQSILSTSLSSTTIAPTPHVTTSYSNWMSSVITKAITPTSSYSKIVNQSILETILQWNMSRPVKSPLLSSLNSISGISNLRFYNTTLTSMLITKPVNIVTLQPPETALLTPTSSFTAFVGSASTSQIYQTPTPSWALSTYNFMTFASSSWLWHLKPSSSSAFYSIPTTTVPVIPVPSNIFVTPANSTVPENSSVILSCNCWCSIRPKWYKNSNYIQYYGPGSPFTLLANGSLLIKVSRQTAGNYRCEITTFSQVLKSKEIKLEVWYLDDIYISSGDQDIFRGENISLTCHGNWHPYPLFTWHLHGEQLKANSRIRIHGNQLNIFNATMNNSGKYRCAAHNPAGNASHEIFVPVKDIPSIALWTNATKYILMGTPFIFACQFSPDIRFPSDIPNMELLKDGNHFYQWTAFHFWHYYYSTPLYSAKQNHTGEYKCKGTVGAASRYSSPFYLTVGVPSGPVVLEREPETSATGIRISWKPISKQFWNGEEITFQVNVSLLDYTVKKSYLTKTTSAIISDLLPATTYIVTITGKTVFGSIQNRTVVVKTKENIDRCENSNSNSCHEYATCKNVVGNYICTCFDGFFGDGKECQGPPQIIAKSASNIIEDVETNLTLVCTVIADPNPTTIWKHTDADGKMIEIKHTSDKFDGNYKIYNARVEDSGTYLCNVSNALGYAYYATKIKIEPVIVNISVEINLSNKTFNEELKNKSSPVYRELEKDVYFELYNFFNNTPGFEDIEILGFVNGSVKVLFRVIVKVLKPSKERNDVVALKVGRKIYKQLKTGRIGKFAVAPSTLKLKAKPPPPANVSYSDVRETKVDIFWDPPDLHQLFSIKRYYISYLKHGEKKWSNDTVGVYDDQSISFQLDNLESDTFYTLKVTAENDYYLGQESKRMDIKTLKVKVLSPWYYIGPIIAVACVVILVAVACLVRRVFLSDVWRPAEDGRRLYGSEKDGKTTFQMIGRGKQYQNTYTNPAFSDTLAKPSWQEIERILIEVSDETLILGEFGIKIVRGTLSCVLGKNKEACSIKLLKENGTTEDGRELMNELKTISAISSHENIVNLIGACTSEDGPPLLVLEFCPRGTLESNLRESDKKREMLINKNKISLANEIAKGMKHLADSRIVHRDLSAKSILITADFTPKISNLGFCRDIYEALILGKSSTPWLAIESLTDGLYTTKSDVWSFAVVMWEIETGGDIPYQEYEVAKLVNQLKKGHRLSKPDDTSDETYKLMLQCWDENPDNRPTFEKIVEIIQKHLVNYESLVDIPLNINT